MSMSRSQLIQHIIEALPHVEAEHLAAIYNLVVDDCPVIASGAECFEHQDMVD